MCALEVREGYRNILTPEALLFLETLEREFGPEREALLARRQERQVLLDQGEKPDFLKETAGIREGQWKIAPIPKDLQDRRVEITGPTNRKMIINALNSGAKVFMADFEDANSPTWKNLLEGQENLKDAVKGTIAFDDPRSGKHYAVGGAPAVLVVRPRGWHLVEKNVLLDGKPISGSLFDFALYFFHNAKTLLEKGSGPYFYLPKLENHKEARLWNSVFVRAQQLIGIPQGSIKATVLIETIMASFEMHEILYELREHSAGLNCGRWDYIFSFIKRFKQDPKVLFPDRGEVTMTQPFMRSYALLTIQTCHQRGAHAIGGMAAQIPIKGDEKANQEAMEKVKADKEREARDGHDGTWVAHPGLVELAQAEFDKVMKGPNQIQKIPQGLSTKASDLLKVPRGNITEAGLRQNIAVGVQYMAAWLSGNGCVPLYNLMEDAATAEISRTQIWQWVHHPEAFLSDGRPVTQKLFQDILEEEMENIRQTIGKENFVNGNFSLAKQLFNEIITNPELEEFLTLKAYEYLEG